MGKSISIPDDLYQRVSEQADKCALPVEAVVTDLLETALSQATDRARVEAVTRAYQAQQSPPFVGDWSRVEQELADTQSPFESVESAMKQIRKRP